jgi:hypothetical protein
METSGTLLFTVKAYKGKTHEITPLFLKNILPRFSWGILPLHEKGRLCNSLDPVPFEFSTITIKTGVYLRELLEAISPFPVGVEFQEQRVVKRICLRGA